MFFEIVDGKRCIASGRESTSRGLLSSGQDSAVSYQQSGGKGRREEGVKDWGFQYPLGLYLSAIMRCEYVLCCG